MSRESLIERLMGFGSGPGHPFVLLAFLALTVSPAGCKRYGSPVWISSVAVGGMFLSYLGVYLISPLDLSWHLQSSLDRVLLQIWPCFLLLFCRLLPDDAGFEFMAARLRLGSVRWRLGQYLTSHGQ